MNIALGNHQYSCSRARKLTEEETQMLISTFHSVDDRHAGCLSREDMKVAVVTLLGYKPSKYEVDKMFEKGESNIIERPDDGISLEHFLEVMTPKIVVQDEDDEIRQTFLAFDSQCRGFVTLEDLKKVFSQVAPHMPSHRVEAAFREIDRDGDGRVSYTDFEYMMKYSMENGF